MKSVKIVLLTILLSLVLATTYSEDSKIPRDGSPYAEVEIVLGKKVSRISVYIINQSDHIDLVFHTGSHGGQGINTDQKMNDDFIGTGITAVPELTFRKSSIKTFSFFAPIYSGSITRRSMRPASFVVKPKERKLYYSFVIPNSYIKGDFVKGNIHVPWANETRENINRLKDALDIPIVKAIIVEK